MATNTYVALDKITLGTATNTLTFSSIPSTYTDLVIVANYGTTAAGNSIFLRLNGDSASNYSGTFLLGSGSTAYSYVGGPNESSIRVFGSPIASGTPSTLIATGLIHIQNYSNSTTNKTVLARSGQGTGEVLAGVGLYRSTSAVTSVTLYMAASSILAGSTFSLYGIKAEPVWTAKATGGTITNDVQYTYHTFTASGTFTPLQNLTCDYLVVAGGGGGGAGGDGAASSGGGGGGAGGYRTTVGTSGAGGSAESQLSAASGVGLTVTVGAGGAANKGQGSDSVFSTITSLGGGGGGNQAASLGATGGSGGGSANASTTGGSGTTNQGRAGGANNGANGGGAGGGGASTVGSINPANAGGAGGDGVTTIISGSSVAYAGGGGGSSYQAGSIGGAGGLGGGGKGQGNNGASVAGSTNTGAGGGGGNSSGVSSAGGSGIVIIRYAN